MVSIRFGHVVLPTGVGKTGLIAMMPFAVKTPGRVLVVSPNLTIREGLGEKLGDVDNFLRDKLGRGPLGIPQCHVFDGEDKLTWAEVKKHAATTHVFVVNSQKLKLHGGLALFPPDFFSLLMFDESHHSAAGSYVAIRDHFSAARCLGFTATPFRGDNKRLPGSIVFPAPGFEGCSISQAIADGNCKKIFFAPVPMKEMHVTRPRDNAKKVYKSVKDAATAGDDDFVDRRGLIDDVFLGPLAKDPNTWADDRGVTPDEWLQTEFPPDHPVRSTVRHTIDLLNSKRKISGYFHQAIMAAENIAQAEQLIRIWKLESDRDPPASRLVAEVVHSRLAGGKCTEIRRVFTDKKKKITDKDKIDVLVHVKTLGEGYVGPVAVCARSHNNIERLSDHCRAFVPYLFLSESHSHV
jgi:hypothetical protein